MPDPATAHPASHPPPRSPNSPPGSAPRQQAWPWWLFRVLTSISAVMLLDQAVFAGQFLSGSYGALSVHRENATFAGISVLLTALGALAVRLLGGGSWWPTLACLALFALIAGQIVLGFARLLTLHVPLGVTIIGLAAGLAIWAWRHGPEEAR